LKNPDEKRSRKSVYVQGPSPWHFASSENTKEKKINSLKEVNGIGARFSGGASTEDAEFLIKAFHNYLMKYVKLLTGGGIEPSKYPTRDTKQFLRLFITASDLRGGDRNAAYRRVSERLPNMAKQSLMSGDDIYNELVVIFLQLAQKFDPNIGGFTGYIQHHFKYAVKTRLFQIQNDPLNYQPLYEERVEESSFSNYICENPEITSFENILRLFIGHTVEDDTIVEKYIDLPVLNKAFVSDPPAPFDQLWTKQQRAIIIKIYVEDKSFSGAAEDLGYSNTATIRILHDAALSSYKRWAACEA